MPYVSRTTKVIHGSKISEKDVEQLSALGFNSNAFTEAIQKNLRKITHPELYKDIEHLSNDDSSSIIETFDSDNKTNVEYSPSEKALFKKALKEKYYAQKKLKFKRGSLYVIKAKNMPGLRFEKRIYKVIQIIWCFDNDVDISSIIVKQVSGPNRNISSLNQSDCQMMHVKYEPGLQIMSMYLNWQPYKKSTK